MKLSEWLSLERGRAAALASFLNIKPPQVSDWCTGKKQIPIEKCVPIERFTAQQVTCEEMRPDKAADFAYLRGLDEQSPAAPEQPAPSTTPRAAGPVGTGWHGIERRDPDAGPNEFPDLDRRAVAL